jgi:hypothetical protein
MSAASCQAPLVTPSVPASRGWRSFKPESVTNPARTHPIMEDVMTTAEIHNIQAYRKERSSRPNKGMWTVFGWVVFGEALYLVTLSCLGII